MSQPRDDRQDDLFRPSLEKIINLRHPLVRLAAEIDWDFLAGRFSSVCRLGPGQPPLPTRLVVGLFILKHMHNLSDEALLHILEHLQMVSVHERPCSCPRKSRLFSSDDPTGLAFFREMTGEGGYGSSSAASRPGREQGPVPSAAIITASAAACQWG